MNSTFRNHHTGDPILIVIKNSNKSKTKFYVFTDIVSYSCFASKRIKLNIDFWFSERFALLLSNPVINLLLDLELLIICNQRTHRRLETNKYYKDIMSDI